MKIRWMMNGVVSGAALLVLWTTGCSLTKPAVTQNQFMLNPGVPAAVTGAVSHAASLRVAWCTVAGPFDDRSLVYRRSALRYEADFYNQFCVPPRNMLSAGIQSWLTAAKVVTTVLPAESALPADYELRGFVTELYGDWRPDQSPAAVLKIQFLLSSQGGVSRKLLMERTYAQRVNLSARTPEALAEGLSQALAKMLEQLTTDLQTLKLPVPGAPTK